MTTFIEFAEHLYTTRKIRNTYSPDTINNFRDDICEDIGYNHEEYMKGWEQWVDIK